MSGQMRPASPPPAPVGARTSRSSRARRWAASRTKDPRRGAQTRGIGQLFAERRPRLGVHGRPAGHRSFHYYLTATCFAATPPSHFLRKFQTSRMSTLAERADVVGDPVCAEREVRAPLGPLSLASLEAMYDAYHRQAFGLAYAVLGDLAAAEDVLLDAFLATWRAEPISDPQTRRVRLHLLGRVARRSIDWLRARQGDADSTAGATPLSCVRGCAPVSRGRAPRN